MVGAATCGRFLPHVVLGGGGGRASPAESRHPPPPLCQRTATPDARLIWSPGPGPSAMGDAGVRDTNADACVKKAACVAKGYWEDPFVGLFAKGRHPHDAPNSPLINRGYWARVSAIWTVVTNFLRAFGGRGPQVLSIGAGWDTLYFRLRSQGLVPHSCVWVEVDFPEVTRRKCEVLAKHADLQRLLPRPEDLRCSATEVVSPAYSVLAADLREAGPLVQRLREAAGLRGSRPVLLVSECVLVYMAPAESDALLRAVAGAFPDLTVVAYEAVGPDDAFGRMMVSNLEARGCPFRGIHAYPSIAAQEVRGGCGAVGTVGLWGCGDCGFCGGVGWWCGGMVGLWGCGAVGLWGCWHGRGATQMERWNTYLGVPSSSGSFLENQFLTSFIWTHFWYPVVAGLHYRPPVKGKLQNSKGEGVHVTSRV